LGHSWTRDVVNLAFFEPAVALVMELVCVL
jgi:hypothetical protein